APATQRHPIRHAIAASAAATAMGTTRYRLRAEVVAATSGSGSGSGSVCGYSHNPQITMAITVRIAIPTPSSRRPHWRDGSVGTLKDVSAFIAYTPQKILGRACAGLITGGSLVRNQPPAVDWCRFRSRLVQSLATNVGWPPACSRPCYHAAAGTASWT